MELRFFAGDDTQLASPIIESLRRSFPGLTASAGLKDGPGVAIAIGPSGLRQALQSGSHARILCLFCSGPSFRELTGSLNPDAARRVSAVYAEAAPSQQMALIHKLYGRRVVVGVLLGQATAYLEPTLRYAAESAKLDVLVAHHTEGSTSRSLLQLSAADVLLTVPDREIYNANSLREVLEASYRRAMPMIGYSTGMVNAGALACAYASVDDVIGHASGLIDAMNTGLLPEPGFCRFWRVAVNDRVARSLNLSIDDGVRHLGIQPPGGY